MHAVNVIVGVLVVVLAIVCVIHVVRRARRGYVAVQSLMAEVNAAANAKAEAQATAANRVDVRVGDGQVDEVVVAQLGDAVGHLLREVRGMRSELEAAKGDPLVYGVYDEDGQRLGRRAD